MISGLIQRFENGLAMRDGTPEERGLDVERVSAVLMIEVARADGRIEETELSTVRRAISAMSTLPGAEIDELVDAAVADSNVATSLYEHLSLLNEQLESADKVRLVEHLWRIAQADGDIDKYEASTIRRLADLLHLSHPEYIRTKIRILGDDAGKA